MSDTAKLSLVAGSWLFHDDDEDNVAMFSPLAPIKIFRLNRPTRRDACAISAHNQVCSLPVFAALPGRAGSPESSMLNNTHIEVFAPIAYMKHPLTYKLQIKKWLNQTKKGKVAK